MHEDHGAVGRTDRWTGATTAQIRFLARNRKLGMLYQEDMAAIGGYVGVLGHAERALWPVAGSGISSRCFAGASNASSEVGQERGSCPAGRSEAVFEIPRTFPLQNGADGTCTRGPL